MDRIIFFMFSKYFDWRLKNFTWRDLIQFCNKHKDRFVSIDENVILLRTDFYGTISFYKDGLIRSTSDNLFKRECIIDMLLIIKGILGLA